MNAQAVLDALRHVEDPDFKKDLVTLNMIRNLIVEGKRVSFTLVLTTPACPLKDMLRNACVTAIKHFVDAEAEVQVNFSSMVTSRTTEYALPGVKNMIAVASGKGGVGKSTVASNLALALAQAGSKVGLLDADIYGPSIPIMFGLENQKPLIEVVNGKNKMIPLEKYGIQIMSIGFLMDARQALPWRGPMASNAFRQLASDTVWEDIDYLVVDLPPGTGDIQITLAQQFPLTGMVLVTTPQAVALTDARKAAAMFRTTAIQIPILGVVENMSYFTTEELPGKKFYLFGKGGGESLANELNVPLLGQIPMVESIREGGDEGKPGMLEKNSGTNLAFEALASKVAQQISITNAQQLPVTAKNETFI